MDQIEGERASWLAEGRYPGAALWSANAARARLGAGAAALALAAAVLSLALATGALGARGDGVLDTTLASRAGGGGGAVGNEGSSNPSSSADGRYVAFSSDASNLDADSNDSFDDVFVRDTLANTTTLVSRATGATGLVGDSTSLRPSISADGRYVAFSSNADNLDSESNDSASDIFVRDTVANTTTLVSRATGATGLVGDDDSLRPSISADGRYVAFSSDANNLDPDSNDSFADIFVRDTLANTTTLVSRATGVAGLVGDNHSTRPSISDSGTRVAFESNATNLDLASDDTAQDVFVRDTLANTTTLVSRATGVAGAVGDENSSSPSISDSGTRVAFESNATNLDFDSSDTPQDIFVRDTLANTTTLVSRAAGVAGAVGDSNSSLASISADGTRIAFDSGADNLDPDSNDAALDVFVRDTLANTTTLVSRATGVAGAVGDDDSFSPSISADGTRVAFDSDAANLDPESDDLVTDVFLRELSDSILPPSADTTAPSADVSAKSKQQAKKPIKVKVGSDEAATVVGSGKVIAKGGANRALHAQIAKKKKFTFKLKKQSKDVAADQKVTLKLKVKGKKNAKKLVKLVKKRAKAKAKITVTLTDLAGNATSEKVVVKLRK